jgi:hypothetical protein
MRKAVLLVLATIFLATEGRADGTYPLYGTHFYGTGEETTIKNGKGMYSVEQLYTQRYTNPSAEVSNLRSIANKGFRIILRLDYDYGHTVPANWDWVARYNYAVKCGQIARDMAGVVNLFVIGNEMTASYEGSIAADWYTIVFNAQDTNSAYDQIKATRPDAKVLMGALSGWPGFSGEAGSNVTFFEYFLAHVEAVDGFAVHAYSGTSFFDGTGGTEDPRFSDMTGLHSFAEYAKRIYAKWGPSVKPIYITETNTYWFKNGFSDRTYRANWIKEAYQAVDQWNQSNDMKVDALCWFTYSHLGITDPNSDIRGNALMRTDNALLNQARADFSWVTANTNLVPGNAGSVLHFEAENFTNNDLWGHGTGLEGTDFHDTTNGNTGAEYRAADDRPEGDVDIGRMADWSGFFVGWVDAGEWLHYQTLAGGRNYKLRVRYARGVAGTGSLRLTVDGVAKGGDVGLASTGNWSVFGDAYGASFYLPPGNHDLRIVSVSGAFNLDYFELIPQ